MITEVNKLISNALCQGRDLYLPEVGSLLVRRSAAARSKSTKFSAPARMVTYTGEERGESVVALIAKTAEVDQARAQEIYAQWLLEVKGDNCVTIDGVGVVANRKFRPEKTFSALLNPEVASVVLKPKTNWTAIVVVLLVVAAAVAAVVWFKNKPEPAPAPMPVVEQPAPAPEPEPVVEKDPDVEDMTPGASYLVWGVFEQKANALKYKKMIASKYGDVVTPVIYHHKENLYMLALAEKPTRNKCLEVKEQLHELDGLFDEMWIFTNK